MKNTLIFTVLLPVMMFSQYSVQIRQEHWAIQEGNLHEWEGELFADLKYNGQLIEPTGFTCEWWRTVHNTSTWESTPFWSDFYKQREGMNTGWWRLYQVKVFSAGSPNPIATSTIFDIEAPPVDGQHVNFNWKKEDGTNIGSETSVHFWSYPKDWHPGNKAEAGESQPLLALRTNETEVLQARPDFLESIGQRFHDWAPTNSFDDPYLNHNSVYVTSTTNELSVNHRTIATNTLIKVQLVDESGSNDGVIEFNDPWLRDTTDQNFFHFPYGYRNKGATLHYKGEVYQIQPNLSNKYKGVFLNENPQYETDLPSYWVKAPFTKSIIGFTSYRQSLTATGALFQNASAEETRVNFTSSNATVTANYKAHLGSSDPNVTSSNAQRKLWSADGAEYYDLMYASAGEIWWTKYQADGTVLVGEQRISSGVGNASSPSIVIAGYDFSPKRYCVWQQYSPSSGLHQIMFSRYTGTAWTTPVNIGWAQYSSNNPFPVITVFNSFGSLDYRVEVVWNQSPTVLATTTSTNNGATWASQTTFTGSGLFRPSVSPVTHYTKYGYNAAGTGLATDDNSQIYYREYWRWEISSGPNSIPTGMAGSSSVANAVNWSTSVAIPGSLVSGSTTNSPSTSQTSSYVWVVWQTYPTDQSSTTMKMIARNLSTDSWTSSYSLSGSGVMRNPQIATRGQDVATAFEIPSSGVRLWKRTYAGVITTTDYPGIGLLPQISGSTNPALGAPRFVVRSTSGSPYEIRYNTSWQASTRSNDEENHLVKSGGDLYERPAEYFGRKVTVMDSVSGDFISISIENPALVRSNGEKTMPVFEAINDTIVDWEGSPWKYLTANLPQLSDAEYLDLDIKVSSNVKQDKRISRHATVGLFDQSLTSLTNLTDVTTQENGLNYTRKVRVNLSGLRDRSLKIMTHSDEWINPERAVCDMEHMYRLSGGSGVQRVLDQDVVLIEPLPTELQLLQNYPNPFNPETHINYQLVEPGHVQLEIYDILGRRVSVLVDAYRPAGFHSASWRIDEKSTGTFIYRITFTGISGETKTLSRKMIVAK